MLLVLMAGFILITSCNQNKELDNKAEPATEKTEVTRRNYKDLYSYEGWFCPDNFGGFPPVDIQEIEKIPVVNDRLPTEEETKNGTALMYLDTSEIPDVRPLEMTLPRVAKIHSNHNDMDELIIVIQAAVSGIDTIVGFRYPSGGNGSAWFNEVTFLSDDEVKELGASPFVYLNTEIKASKEQIWKAISGTNYGKELGEKLNMEAFFESGLISDRYLDYESENERATGSLSMLWGNLYLHIDYDLNGRHYSEKMLVIENTEDNTAELHLAAGPHSEDYAAQQTVWSNWLQEVKARIEAE